MNTLFLKMSQTVDSYSEKCRNDIDKTVNTSRLPLRKSCQDSEQKRRVSKFTDSPVPSVNGNRPSKFSDKPPDAAVAPKVDPVQAAAAAAAKINATLRAKGKLSDETLLKPAIPVAASAANSILNMIQISPTTTVDDVFVAKIDVNGLPLGVRSYFTQLQVLESISQQTGAAVSTKGQYLLPDEKARLTGIEKQLHLCIHSPVKLQVDMALSKLRDMIARHPVPSSAAFSNLPVANASSNASPQLSSLPMVGQPTLPTGNYVQEKVFVAMDNAPEDFDVRTKLIGNNYTNFNFIANSTGAKVILRGRGSGFIEPTSGKEAFEAMYVFISHPTQVGVDNARKLVQNLIDTVRTDLATFVSQKVGGVFAQSTGGNYVSQNYMPTYPSTPSLVPPNSFNTISNYPFFPSPGNPPPHYSTPVPTMMLRPPTVPPMSYAQVLPQAPRAQISPVPASTFSSVITTDVKASEPSPVSAPVTSGENLMPPPPVPVSAKVDSKPSKRRRFQEEVPDDSNILGYKQVSSGRGELGREEKPKKLKRTFKEDTSIGLVLRKEPKEKEKVNANLPFWMSHSFD